MEGDELDGLEGLKVVSHADVERAVIGGAEQRARQQMEERWRKKIDELEIEIEALLIEREEVESKLVTSAGSLRQVEKWSARLDEIPKKLEELEKCKSFFADRLTGTNQNNASVWNQVSQSLLSGQESSSLENPSKIDMLTPFGTAVSIGGRKTAVRASRDPLKKSLLQPKKRKKKEKLGTTAREDLAYVRSLKPGAVAGELESMPRDVDERDSDEYVPDEDLNYDSDTDDGATSGKPLKSTKKRPKPSSSPSTASPRKRRKLESIRDDGDYATYQKRLQELHKSRVKLKHERMMNGEDEEEEEETFETFPGGYKIAHKTWNQLFAYQQVTVRWLWELKGMLCGGIVGDEMGLGKTIQIIAYLIGLAQSKLYDPDIDVTGLGPVLIVAPTTVMYQWVAEFRRWYPEFRVAILHSTGTFSGKRHDLIREILHHKKGILITSYTGMVHAEQELICGDWQYVILDEGHKIRNPDAQTTQVVKRFKTPHRIILSGSPLQNNLKELWSLFDFVFPGKLGTLEVFMKEFSIPITLGGYATATDIEVATAYRCATILKDAIAPYMIRRMKTSVQEHIKLPTKNEQVLFCKLTDRQRELYVQFLESRQMKSIYEGSTLPFVGLTYIRKICNHPHLYDGGPKDFGNENQMELSEEERFGYWKLSGKMIVLESLLRIWKKQNHKVLLFSQSRQMLAILEAFVISRSYTYLKIDGTTAIQARQPLIKQFNEDKNLFVFLLTTRVGGLGVNLTGASRVLIFDPDWNPSTDTQARERAWRIGQTKHVTIYRLITTGTIEEKIFHRQIFKQYLTNRVLSDPEQRRFFKQNEMKDLFTLDDPDAYKPAGASENGSTSSSLKPESTDIFAGTGSEIKLHKLGKKKKKSKDKEKIADIDDPKERRKKMMELAKKLSKQVAGKSDEKKKKKKFAKVDGERVVNVVKRKEYKSAAESVEESVEDEDNYVLRKLFKKSGVHAALRHDKIVNDSGPDHALVEGEAESMAQQAIEALKRSRRFYDGLSRYGGDQRFAGPSSSSSQPRFGKKNPRFAQEKATQEAGSARILEKAKQRNKFSSLFANKLQSRADEPPEMPDVSEDLRELLDDIRTFVAFGAKDPGKASTQELLNKFKEKLPKDQSHVFKALLNKLCDFCKEGGAGMWSLKAEFR